MNDDHRCPSLDQLLPNLYVAPSMAHGVENYRIYSYLLLAGIDSVIVTLDMLGLEDHVMLALKEARDTIDSELMCEDLVHHEIFTQFLRDGMKFLPALQAAHRV